MALAQQYIAIQEEQAESLFAKLEVAYSRTRVICRLRHRNWVQARRYAIVAADANSVAIEQFGKLAIENRRKYDVVNLKIVEELFPAEPKIEHIHLDKGHYWISLGNGRNREFFMRIRPSAGP
jgi:hypothetical protein